MANVRPFRGLRFNTQLIGDLGLALSPPYDVVSPEQRRQLLARSPFNIINLELAEANIMGSVNDDYYCRIANKLRSWRDSNIIVIEDKPTIYLHQHRFLYKGEWLQRREIIAAVRLEEWDKGIIKPHEDTLSSPKQDRLNLMRACKVAFSPIMALYADSQGNINSIITESTGELIAEAKTRESEHKLYSFCDPENLHSFNEAFAPLPLYIADGHHRYEASLMYSNEIKETSPDWSEDSACNYVMMHLIDAEDPGLLVLSTYRLVRSISEERLESLTTKLAKYFDIEPMDLDKGTLDNIDDKLSSYETTTFGLVANSGENGYLLRLRNFQAIESNMPTIRPITWRKLDVSILHTVILNHILNLPEGEGEHITYTRDTSEVLNKVKSGEYQLAFFLAATPVSQILAVADDGARMPQKSTYFYPKCPTGLVLNPLESRLPGI